ncbi:hypothetical protein P691DRAFT_417894 [Macrolepiota fuliginosa MF-IS2]|uniref:Uncharacterized protein n=1 Tax=Macrolepiota fuliginosa MF-IS2 TaxID=1400762 RepID=A0A9P5X4P3_9AGAR|nr:hypothetical protein P691DRAFT_417894 [Macrolepiota fuliginosa MF-IS2]
MMIFYAVSIVRRSSFATHLRKKHPDIRHLVTKEFLDEIEGPRLLKPRSRRGRRIRSATMSAVSDPHVLAKVAGYYGHDHPRRAATVDDEIMAPVPTKYSTVMGLDVEKVEKMSAVDNKAELEFARKDADGMLILLGLCEIDADVFVASSALAYVRRPQFWHFICGLRVYVSPARSAIYTVGDCVPTPTSLGCGGLWLWLAGVWWPTAVRHGGRGWQHWWLRHTVRVVKSSAYYAGGRQAPATGICRASENQPV